MCTVRGISGGSLCVCGGSLRLDAVGQLPGASGNFVCGMSFRTKRSLPRGRPPKLRRLLAFGDVSGLSVQQVCAAGYALLASYCCPPYHCITITATNSFNRNRELGTAQISGREVDILDFPKL